jgi:hypothetical protein
MSRLVLVPIDRPEAPPWGVSPRLRQQLVYFMSARDTAGIPPLGDDEYWFAAAEVAKWVDEGVFYLVSPLDTDTQTEVELSEEQESFLAWLYKYNIEHARLEERPGER